MQLSMEIVAIDAVAIGRKWSVCAADVKHNIALKWSIFRKSLTGLQWLVFVLDFAIQLNQLFSAAFFVIQFAARSQARVWQKSKYNQLVDERNADNKLGKNTTALAFIIQWRFFSFFAIDIGNSTFLMRTTESNDIFTTAKKRNTFFVEYHIWKMALNFVIIVYCFPIPSSLARTHSVARRSGIAAALACNPK